MIIQATKRGLGSARANWKLVATLWLVNALLAVTAAIPGWLALNAAMGNLPLTDSLVRELSFGIVSDLLELHPGLLNGLGYAAVALFVTGALAGLAVAGGALEVLTSEAGSFADRFGRGAFRHYGRFLRLGIATTILAALTAGIVAGPLFMLRNSVRREYGNESLTLALLATATLAGALMLLLALLAQDAARVMIVRDDTRGVLRALWRGMKLVWRHPIAWLGTWTLNAILLLVAFAAYFSLADAVGVAMLAIAVVLQQLFVIARCTLRVALTGAELALVPVPPVIEAPPVAEALPQAGETIDASVPEDSESAAVTVWS